MEAAIGPDGSYAPRPWLGQDRTLVRFRTFGARNGSRSLLERHKESPDSVRLHDAGASHCVAVAQDHVTTGVDHGKIRRECRAEAVGPQDINANAVLLEPRSSRIARRSADDRVEESHTPTSDARLVRAGKVVRGDNGKHPAAGNEPSGYGYGQPRPGATE